jgi:hypothetical protein
MAALVLLAMSDGRGFADDGHVEQGGERFKQNPTVVSPVILQNPIYACADTVVVKGFKPHAEIEVFLQGNSTPIGIDPDGLYPDGQPVKVTVHFTANQVVTARQVIGGQKGPPSNAVTVKNFQEDYPNGLPQPRIDPATCLDCGAAVGAADVVPGATWTVFAETPTGGGGYGPKAQIGSNQDFPYALVSPPLSMGQRVTIGQSLCTSTSQPSAPQIVQSDPPSIPKVSVDAVFPGADRVTVQGVGGQVLDGATILVTADYGPAPSHRVGGQPSPGAGAQQVFISPVAPASGSHTFAATQALCTKGPAGPTTTEQSCSALPAPQIRPPAPGDTSIDVTQSVPGAEILVFASGPNPGPVQQIGAGGGSTVALTQAVAAGETLFVEQVLGACTSQQIYVAPVGCTTVDPNVCSADWPTFRHSGWRDGQQPVPSVLADPDKVRKLKIQWTFKPPSADGTAAFKASPIIFQNRVFIGNGNGRLYALDANSGMKLWEYPKPPAAALTSQFHTPSENASSAGVASSATIAMIENKRAAVVFAAPDQSIGAHLGSGRLFALDPASGAEIWKSPEIAVLNGLTTSTANEAVAITQKHENLGYSAPLALGNLIYVGIGDHGDDPIQAGRLVAVNLSNGSIASGFAFSSTGTRGGDIWSPAAGGLDKGAIAVTTGNSAFWNGGQQSEPQPDHALSMLGLSATSGAIDWTLRAVPFEDDNDPDWASGPSLLDAACGHTAASTQKDGWAYAERTSGGRGPSVAWQFPPTGIPFAAGDMRHGDTRYIRSGAGWNDTFIATVGGYEVEASQPYYGFTQLHALDVCAPPSAPVRWIANIPDTAEQQEYQLGPPTVTHGVVFVGTAMGHLVVLADPSIYPSANSICSNPTVNVGACVGAGYTIVAQPLQIADVDLKSGSIQTEPALAGGRVFVATDDGVVVMLKPQ